MRTEQGPHDATLLVSMKSGLEDRNNCEYPIMPATHSAVSMKSGLEDRNNALSRRGRQCRFLRRLNEVRPRRPEQSGPQEATDTLYNTVSMKSGLEDRNNQNPTKLRRRHPLSQ